MYNYLMLCFFLQIFNVVLLHQLMNNKKYKLSYLFINIFKKNYLLI